MRRTAAGLLAVLLVPTFAAAQDAACPTGECYREGSGENCPSDSCDKGSLIARLRAKHACGECKQRTYGCPDLFYNFWVPPTCGGVGAQLYLAPEPIPANVGHTYYTYQPFMPHEWLYPHKRRYHRYYDEGRGLTRTRAKWSTDPIYQAMNLRNALRIAR